MHIWYLYNVQMSGNLLHPATLCSCRCRVWQLSLYSVIYLNMAMFISLFTVYFHLCSHDHGMFKQLSLFKLICCDSLLNVLCLYFHHDICNLLDYNSDIRICISRNTFKNTSLIFMFSFLGLQQPHKEFYPVLKYG